MSPRHHLPCSAAGARRRARFIALVSALVLVTSCRTPTPRAGTPPIPRRDSETNIDAYVAAYRYAPELMGWNRALVQREGDLRTTFFTRQALTENRVRVRLVAPPLQLTGNESLDLSRTYRATVVADDLPPEALFLDHYDVRVLPDPKVASIEPSRSAGDEAAADLVYAQERLRRAELDEAWLEGEQAFADHDPDWRKARLDTMTQYVGGRLTAVREELARLTTERTAATTRVATTVDDEQQAVATRETKREDVAASEQALAGALQGNDAAAIQTAEAAAGPAREALAAAEAELANARAERAAAENHLLSLKVPIAAAETELARLQAREEEIQRIRDRSKVVAANRALVGSVKSFWSDEVTNLAARTRDGTHPGVAMKSAVTIAFRPEALQYLDKFTIEVRRKRASPTAAYTDPDRAFRHEVRATLHAVGAALDELSLLARIGAERVDARLLADRQAAALHRLSVARGELQRHAAAAVPALKRALAAVATALDDAEQPAQGVLEHVGAALVELEAPVIRPPRAELIVQLKEREERVGDYFQSLGRDGDPVVQQPAREALTLHGEVARGLRAEPPNVAIVQRQLDRLEATARDLDEHVRARNQAVAAMAAAAQEVRSIVATRSTGPLTGLRAGRLATLREQLGQLFRENPGIVHGPGTVWRDLERAAAAWLVVTSPDEALTARQQAELRDLEQILTEFSNGLAGAVAASVALLRHGGAGDFPGSVPVTSAPAAAAGPSSFDQIASGDLAVFQLNVLRGLVSTTAYLLPDTNAAQLFGPHFAKEFFVAQVSFRNPNDKPILLYGASMRLIVQMTAIRPDTLGVDGRPEGRYWWTVYQPLDADAVRRMMLEGQEHTWQKWASNGIAVTASLLSAGSVFSSSLDLAKGASVFGGIIAPQARRLLEADFARYADHFRETGLDSVEKIEPGGFLTRFVFLPKGPIYGDYAIDTAAAAELHQQGRDEDFARRALLPTYIYTIRREEVFVEGQRILDSDPLTSVPAR